MKNNEKSDLSRTAPDSGKNPEIVNSGYILSLESSDETCGVALSHNGNILGSVNYFKRNLHDKLLAELCASVIRDLNISFGELNAIAVSAGPGSFTGLRISASIAKGLCFGYETKLIAVSNAEAYAFAALEYAEFLKFNKIVTLINSNAKFVYSQEFNVYDFKSSEIQILDIQEFDNPDVVNTLYVGSGSRIINQQTDVSGFAKPKVEFIAKLAEKLFSLEQFCEPAKYEPTYIQDFNPKPSTKKLNI